VNARGAAPAYAASSVRSVVVECPPDVTVRGIDSPLSQAANLRAAVSPSFSAMSSWLNCCSPLSSMRSKPNAIWLVQWAGEDT
jgi:hypothetical protein